MNKGRRAAGVALGAGLIICTVIAGCHYFGTRAQVDGERYVRTTVEPALWDADALIRIASSDLLTEVPPEQMRTAVRKIADGLGPLKAVRNIQSRTYSVNLSMSGLRFFPSYDIQADFANGPGDVSVLLLKEHGEWRVRRLRVSSAALTF